MGFFKILRIFFYISAISIICILASSVFNESISEHIECAAQKTMTALIDFSKKAESNVFSEVAR